MKNILFLTATAFEYDSPSILNSEIFEIGVGKVVSAVNTTRLIEDLKPDLVINFGSVGNLEDYQVGDVLEVGEVFNDIDARPFAEYGDTPFTSLSSIRLSDSGIKCFTTDCFYHSTNDYSDGYWGMIKQCDVVDMELYSIAYCCKSMGIPLKSYKWVSDSGDSSKWRENAMEGFHKFKSEIVNKFR
jgi:adenosylhomocysteine nucleosidase